MRTVAGEVQTEQNKRIFVAAGRKVLCSKPGSRLNVRDVVREAGLEPKAFYKCFSDKEALLVSIVEEIVIPFRMIVRNARSTAQSGREFFRASLTAGIRLVLDATEICEMARVNRFEFRKYFNLPHISEPCLKDIIIDLDRGIKYGIFRDHDSRIVGELFLSILLDLCVHAALKPEDAENMVEFKVGLLAPAIEPRMEAIKSGA